MKKMLVVVLVLGLLLVGSVCVYNFSTNEINIDEVKIYMEEKFQGPVPIGYDLEHFRKTGETIMEVID